MQSREFTYAFDVAKRPLLRGVARLLDFGGGLNRQCRKRVLEFYTKDADEHENGAPLDDDRFWRAAWQRDAEAIASDWKAVGDGLRWAISEHEKELPREKRV